MTSLLVTMFAAVCALVVSARVVSGCGFPGSPAHSSVTFSNTLMEAGTEALYSCDRGFELLGPNRRLCQDNGTWAPSGIPFCVINVAAGKAPMQSSTLQEGIPQKAVDGSTSGLFSSQTCTLTQPEAAPLWYVNLLEPFMIQLVRIDFGRACCEHNLPATVVVRVGNNRPDLLTNPICNRYTGIIEEGRPLFLPCNPPMPGAFVSVHLEGPGQKKLSICETFVYTDQALPVERCPQFRGQPLGASATYNGRCYTFYNEQPRSFGRAQEFCASRKGTLISETSPALQGFLSWELWRRHRSQPDGQYWLGAVRDSHRPTIWSWLNGPQVSISFWSDPGRVVGGDCARLDATKDWLWSAADCRQRLNFVCQHEPLTCGQPEQPPDSVMSGTDFSVGARIVYRCQPGHLLVGPEERECLTTGFYSGYPPTCKRLQCGLPADIADGSYRFENGSRAYLSTVSYSCDPGFSLVGRSELICDVDERWNGPPPRCQEIRCGTPPAVLNGAYRSRDNDTTVGALFEYYCLDDRFELLGAALLRCGADGEYDHEPPICRAPEATTTTAATAVTVDFSFLDEALAASASEVDQEHTIDLGDLLESLLGTGHSSGDVQGAEGHQGTTGNHEEVEGKLTGSETHQGAEGTSGDTGIYVAPVQTERNETWAASPPADIERQGPSEYASEIAAAQLAAATDLSFAYQPTEGSPAAFDISIHYRPAGEAAPSAAPALQTDPHRRGRPLATRPSFPGGWDGGVSAATPRPDGASGDLNWSERTPEWPASPPRLTISLSDLPTRDSTGDSPSRSVYDRTRPRPTPAATPGGFFRVVPPAELERNEAAAEDPREPSSYPGHRRRYRPVVRQNRLPTPADVGSYGLRRRFRPISLADIAATDYPASEKVSERRKSFRSEENLVTHRAPVERLETLWGSATSTTESSRLPPIDFTLMPPSFWPDLNPAQSDNSESGEVSLPPYRPIRRRPPPAPASDAEYDTADDSADFDSADYDSIEPTEFVPPTMAWEPARTSASAPLPDLTPPNPTWSPTPRSPPSPALDSTTPPPDPLTSTLEPVTHPLDPVTHLLDPVTHPLDPVTHPLDPVIHPLDPVTHPLDPFTHPLNPVAHPLDPVTPPPAAREPAEPPPATAAEPVSTAAPEAAVPETVITQEPAGYDRAEESQEPDTVNIRQNVRPGVRLPGVGEDRREPRDDTTTVPKLNMSGIIALGVFGGFVFLTAVLTSIVIIVRRTQQRTRRPSGSRRHHYISSSYSTDSDSRGLSRPSRRGGWSGGRPPAGRRSSSQGYRDSAEVTVADVSHMFRGGDKRRHHHHHHHHRHNHGDERARRH